MNSHEGGGLKMVPKRQIQLKKKTDAEKEKAEKLQVSLLSVHYSQLVCLPVCLFTCPHFQVIQKDGPVSNSEVSANESLCPVICQHPDLLLRQHSMPAALQTHSTISGDVDSHRVYKGLVAGASQGNNACASQEASSTTACTCQL